MSDRILAQLLINFETELRNFRSDIGGYHEQASLWLEQRKKTIDCLNSVIEKLDRVHREICRNKGAVCGQAAGAGVWQFIGLAMAANPVGQAILIGSSVASVLNLGASLILTGVEKKISNECMAKVKKEVELDQKLFRKIDDMLQHTRPLHDALKKLLGPSFTDSPSKALDVVLLAASTISEGYESYAQVINTVTSSSQFKSLGNISQARLLNVVQDVGKSEESLRTMKRINCTVKARSRVISILKGMFKFFKDYYAEISTVCFVGGGAAICGGILKGSMKWGLFQGIGIAALILESVANQKAFENNEPSQYSAALCKIRKHMIEEVSRVKLFLLEAP